MISFEDWCEMLGDRPARDFKRSDLLSLNKAAGIDCPETATVLMCSRLEPGQRYLLRKKSFPRIAEIVNQEIEDWNETLYAGCSLDRYGNSIKSYNETELDLSFGPLRLEIKLNPSVSFLDADDFDEGEFESGSVQPFLNSVSAADIKSVAVLPREFVFPVDKINAAKLRERAKSILDRAVENDRQKNGYAKR